MAKILAGGDVTFNHPTPLPPSQPTPIIVPQTHPGFWTLLTVSVLSAIAGAIAGSLATHFVQNSGFVPNHHQATADGKSAKQSNAKADASKLPENILLPGRPELRFGIEQRPTPSDAK